MVSSESFLKSEQQPPPAKATRRLIVWGLLVPCLLIAIPPIIAYRSQKGLTDSFHWVSHTAEVQRQLQHLMALIDDTEAGQRGFLLTGREDYLEPYQLGVEQIPHQIESIRFLTADNPAQQTNLRELAGLVATRLGWMSKTSSLQRSGNHADATTMVAAERGHKTMEAIRARLDLMVKEESHLVAERQKQLVSSAAFNTGVLIILVILNVGFAVIIYYLFRHLPRVRSLVTMCAWSRTVEYRGEWLSFEEYLLQRFNIDTSHGISPEETRKALDGLQRE
jgi:CHASE3 domain sensor protein